jgi:hypothetical protein
VPETVSVPLPAKELVVRTTIVTAARKNVPTAPASFPVLTDGIGALLMVEVRSRPNERKVERLLWKAPVKLERCFKLRQTFTAESRSLGGNFCAAFIKVAVKIRKAGAP